MQDIKPLIDYYGESPRKNKRRFELLQQLFHHLVECRGFNDNMSQICKAINVERKTVYRYYNSKEDIISEVNYYVHIKRNYELAERIEEIIANENLNSIDKFIVIMNVQLEIYTKYRDDMAFVEFAKRISTNLDKESETYKRYTYLMNNIEFDHYRKILLTLEADHELNDGINADEYSLTINQILYSFISQTYEYEHDFYSYDNANISKAIKLVAKSVLKNY